jgi:riboflavin kinase / FMN adenylyltransferase
VDKDFMDVIRGVENIPTGLRCAVVTIGNFDGIHLGHQLIVRRLVEEARREKCPAVVISFDPHPKMVLHPERRPFYLITSLEEKIALLAGLDVDAFILIPFSLEYARTTAEEFVRSVLDKRLHIRKIIIGHDYTFGRGKEGNEAFLSAFGKRLGFAVEVMNAVRIGETTVSSTRIREALLAGEVRLAASLLGRPYNLSGRVVSGSRRGVRLGFPTANIRPDKELVPARGVYAVHVLLGGIRHEGALSISINPTFTGGKLSIEVHILDFHEDIYDKTLDMLFIERLRDEIRFNSPEELIAQIDRDIARVREILRVER